MVGRVCEQMAIWDAPGQPKDSLDVGECRWRMESHKQRLYKDDNQGNFA